MDWDKLRVFHAVADAGSLTHAGDELHLSQSAISRQIRGLEEQLGATLFHRHARGLLLTEQGELLYNATCEMTKRLTQAAAQIGDTKDEVFGDLRVTTTAGFGTSWLAPRLPTLFEAHPDLSVNLILTENMLDLGMREADVAIRFGDPTQADLIRRPLMEMRMRLYASEDYIAKWGAPHGRGGPRPASPHQLQPQRAAARRLAGLGALQVLGPAQVAPDDEQLFRRAEGGGRRARNCRPARLRDPRLSASSSTSCRTTPRPASPPISAIRRSCAARAACWRSATGWSPRSTSSTASRRCRPAPRTRRASSPQPDHAENAYRLCSGKLLLAALRCSAITRSVVVLRRPRL